MALSIKISDLENGMILSEPIINKFGQVLLPSGTVLKEKHERLLKTWNIHTITIKSEEDDATVSLSRELIEMAMKLMRERVSWQPSNVFERNLLKAAVLNKAEVLSKKEDDFDKN